MAVTVRAPLAVELGTGAPLISGLAAVGTALLIGGVLASTDGMLPGWADPLNLALTACLYLGPLAAGAAAFHVSSLHASGMLELASTTPRGRTASTRVAWLAVAGWQLLAFMVLSGLVLVRSDLSGGFSPAMLLLPAQAVLIVASCMAAGVALARCWQHQLAAPVVAVALFAILYLTALSTTGLRVLFPEIAYQEYLEPSPELLSSTTLALAFATVTTWACLAARRASRSRAVGFATATVLLAGSAVTWTHADEQHPVTFRSPPHSATCHRQHDVRLCTWPSPSHWIPDDLARLDRMHSLLAPYDAAAPTDFYEVGLVTPAGGAAYEMLRPDGFAHGGAEEALAFFPPPTCSRPAVMRAHRDLVRWLIDESSPDLSRGEHRSHDEHRVVAQTWVDERLSLVRSGCS